MAYGSLQRRRRRESTAWANPALVPNLTTARPGWRRHLPPFLLLLALAIAGRRAGPPAADGRGTAARGQRDHGHRHLGLDERDRRLARPADRGRRGGQDADREGPGDVPARAGDVLGLRRAARRARRPTGAQIRGALDQLVAEGGTAMGDGLERGLFAARTPVPNANGTGVRRLPSVIVLLSDGKNTSGTRDPVQVAREAGRARIPIYTIALGTAAGEVELRDSFGFLQRVQVPPDTETLKEVARDLRRQVLHRHRDRQGQGDLREPRHAAVVAQREARGDGVLRGRRAVPARSPPAASHCAGSAGLFRPEPDRNRP